MNYKSPKMELRNYKLLSCRNTIFGVFIPKRLTFDSHGPSVPPSREELIEAEVREGVALEKRQFEGFYLTNPPNPVIEAGRLGVRTEIAATLRRQGTDIQQGIINERISAQLRVIAKERVSEHHQQMGWLGTKLHSAGNAMSDLTNPFRAVGRFFGSLRGGGTPNNLRYNDADERHLAHEMEHLFGQHRDVPHVVDHILTHIDLAHMTAAVPHMGVIPTTPAALEAWLRGASVEELEARRDNARRAPDREFTQAYELLLNVRRVEARERSKILSIELYDPTRLRRFLEAMKGFSNDDYKILTEQILEPGSLDNLDSDATDQALVAHMLFVYESSGTPPNMATLHTELTSIRDSLPEVKDETKAGEEKAENVKTAEKIDEQSKAVKTNVTKLNGAYRKATPVARRIIALEARRTSLTAAGGATMDPKARAAMVTEIEKQIDKLEDTRNNILSDVTQSEQDYKDSSNELIATLLKSQKQTAIPAGVPRITELETGAAHPLSTENQLFRIGGATASPLEAHIGTLNNTFFDELNTQINDNYKKIIKGRERISSRHLLVYLKDKRLAAQGVLDEGRRMKMAIFSANLAIADVKSIDLYRSGNREIAETMITGWAGWRRRAVQSIASKFFNSNTFNTRDIIDHVAGVDKEGSYEFLKGMNPDSSLADLRRHIREHHVSLEALGGARAHLQKILEGLAVGHHDRVEIADTSWNIENLIHNLLLMETELESREFFDKVANPSTPEDKKLSKAQYMKKLWTQTKESDQKRQENILTKLANFPNTLKKYLMTGVWGTPYKEGMKHCEENGITGDARKEYLRKEKGIPEAVLKHLMTGLALKEAYDLTRGTVGWAGKKLGKGVKATAGFTKEKGGNLLSAAWNRIAKPGARAAGTGLKKAGKFTLWTAPKFLLWTAPKAILWNGPAWAFKTTAKAAWWPFKMAGKGLSGFWNVVHYTPEKAAKDAAKYAKKAAPKGGGGGHGGGH